MRQFYYICSKKATKAHQKRLGRFLNTQFALLVLVLCQFPGLTLSAQQLPSYIAEAEANNPEIEAFNLRYGIAQEKLAAAEALPNTTIGAGYFVSEPETRTGAQRGRISVAQALPWFGTIGARIGYARSVSESELVEVSIAKRKLALAVTRSYYRLYANQAIRAVLLRNIELLQTYERLALTSIEVGTASAVEIFKLQIRQNELQERQQLLLHEYAAEQVAFKNLIGAEGDRPLAINSTVSIPIQDKIYDREKLLSNPELELFEKRYETIEFSEKVNQKEATPSFAIGLDYIPVSERAGMNFSDNGKDIIMPMVSFSVPIFNSGFKSVTRQNALRQQEIEALRAQRLNTLETTLAQVLAKRDQARISYQLVDENLRKARNAEEILLKNYETGTVNFNDLLDIQELQLKFEIERIETVENYFEATATLNYLTEN